MQAVFRHPTFLSFFSNKPHPPRRPWSWSCSPLHDFSPMKQSLPSPGDETVQASPIRSTFVSNRTAKPRHSSSFHSHVSFLLAIFLRPIECFLGFVRSGVFPSTQRTSSPLVPRLLVMAIFSASRSPDSRALIGDSFWPSVTTYNMRPLSASRGAMNPLILLYRTNLYSASAYAFWMPSSSLRHIVASYELPISRSASSRKAPNAFLNRIACLSRPPVPLSASDPPL